MSIELYRVFRVVCCIYFYSNHGLWFIQHNVNRYSVFFISAVLSRYFDSNIYRVSRLEFPLEISWNVLFSLRIFSQIDAFTSCDLHGYIFLWTIIQTIVLPSERLRSCCVIADLFLAWSLSCPWTRSSFFCTWSRFWLLRQYWRCSGFQI